jgi:2-methylisocitrate lyase-like PEP mutase family enzyme
MLMSATANSNHADRFREYVSSDTAVPLIGVYDVFSARLAAKRYPAVFCSGYSYTASHYGLPDEGFLTWTDTIDYAARLRAVLPDAHIVMDIDDGFGNEKAARITASRLQAAGVSALILEDQRRPKKCGHLKGKEVIPLDEYLEKLLAVRNAGVYTIARSDAEDPDEALFRARTFAAEGAEAVLVDGIKDINMIAAVREAIGEQTRLVVNLIPGGNTPMKSLRQMAELGVNIVNYSTPCLFAAQLAVEAALDHMLAHDGLLPQQQEAVFSRNRDVLKV